MEAPLFFAAQRNVPALIVYVLLDAAAAFLVGYSLYYRHRHPGTGGPRPGSRAWLRNEKAALGPLSPDQRGEVVRAVRQGRAVNDPALASYAADQAARRLDPGRLPVWYLHAGALFFVLAGVFIIVYSEAWFIGVFSIAFFGGGWAFAQVMRPRFSRALTANRALAEGGQ